MCIKNRKEREMKALIYPRVSTKEQEDSGYSLPSQEKLLNDYCRRKDLEVGKVFRIAESASGKLIRKTFNEMIEYAKKNKINNLVFEKVDRATRNFKEAEALNDWLEEDPERKIHSVKDGIILHKNSTSQEKLNWNIRLVLAKNYIDNLSEEVRKGQKEKIAQGEYPSQPPLGYKSEGNKGRRIHVIDESVAPYIRRIFEMYATGLSSVEKVAKVMEKEGLRSKRGGLVRKRMTYEILKNLYYTGKFKWNGIIYQGKHEPIISEELYNMVQDKLHGKKAPLIAKKDYLFRGLIKCSHCGTSILWEDHKGITYGHCNYRHSKCAEGRGKWIKEKDIYADIAESFGSLAVKNPRIAEWIKSSLQESHHDEIEYRETKIRELNSIHDKLSKRLDRLYEDRLDEIIPDSVYREKFEKFTHEKTEIIAEIEKLSVSSDVHKELGLKVFEVAQEAKSKFLTKAPTEKKKLVRGLCEKLELEKGNIKISYNLAYDILGRAVLATNSSDLAKIDVLSEEMSEPIDFGSINAKTGSLEPVSVIWRSRRDSNPRPPP